MCTSLIVIASMDALSGKPLIGELARLCEERIHSSVVKLFIDYQRGQQILLGSHGGPGIKVLDGALAENLEDESFGCLWADCLAGLLRAGPDISDVRDNVVFGCVSVSEAAVRSFEKCRVDESGIRGSFAAPVKLPEQSLVLVEPASELSA
ncbi:MAG: hypothetical protein JO345_08335 [Streptosporangiaceae bacterium]|nr:hypothetical protein [Streptosporangiaceae bacterium]